MTTLAAPSTITTSALRTKALYALLVLATFGAYSVWVVAAHGYTGFLSLAGREPWGMQMLLDLVIACSFGVGWMVRDARKHGIAAWPFVVVTVFLGSIGLLAYVARRGLLAKS
ncbi:MAG: DUF2834 domain-containing protein [Kofleriaceae bacterium]|nr:DUF2834 domain-containing protein [Kofleriaceae bacterium]